MALVNQHNSAEGKSPAGFINPQIYSASAGSEYGYYYSDRMMVYLRRYLAGAGNSLNLGLCGNTIECMCVLAGGTGSR